MRTSTITLLSLLLVSACIGTDYEDDPKDSAILTDVEAINLMIGQSATIQAQYWYNMWVSEEVVLVWHSNNPEIATVDQAGLVKGVGKGQTSIVITYPGEDTVSVAVSVVETSLDVARVEVTSNGTSLDLGETLQLTAQAYTLTDDPLNGLPVTWFSSNEAHATVDATGLVTALTEGEVDITATIEGVQSPPYRLMLGLQARVGTFQESGSYKAIGTATLFINGSDQLTLNFSSDFETSFALGTFVYLANSTSGTVVRAQGFEIAEVTSNGAKTYNISALYPSVGLDDYQYVILLCKPASITFGFADLN